MDTDSPTGASSESDTASQYKAHVEAMQRNCVEKITQLMEHYVPEKIAELDQLIDAGHFDVGMEGAASACEAAGSSDALLLKDAIPVPSQTAREQQRPAAPGSPVCVLFPRGQVGCQQELQTFAEKIKEHLRDQARLLLDVSEHLTLLVPTQQSGNLFGLMILGSFFMHIVKFTNESQKDLAKLMTLNRDRVKLVTDVAKYPDCEDARSALRYLDDEHAARYESYAEQIRNRYCILLDAYIKNRERIHEPVTENPMVTF